MSEQENTNVAATQGQEPEGKAPVRIDCTVDGLENDYLLFKPTGWRFKHLRLWEQLPSVEQVVELVMERLVSWGMHDQDTGESIPFEPYIEVDIPQKRGLPKKTEQQFNPEALDGLAPDQAAWVTAAFRLAYSKIVMPDPNF